MGRVLAHPHRRQGGQRHRRPRGGLTGPGPRAGPADARARPTPGPGRRAGSGPGRPPQQSHLDFGVPDLDTAHARVLAHGATLLDAGEDGRSRRVYADPAGHPFCLVRH
nr:VOC family protein [Streptomyces sp. WAC08241]